jgi:hypothetical protein
MSLSNDRWAFFSNLLAVFDMSLIGSDQSAQGGIPQLKDQSIANPPGNLGLCEIHQGVIARRPQNPDARL